MKKMFLLCLLLAASSCEPEEPSGNGGGTPGIYITFSTESPVLSYSDNNACVPSAITIGKPYGPCGAGEYFLSASLQNGMNFSQQKYVLLQPEDPATVRNYNIRFYYDQELNRWLYGYSFFDEQ